MKVYLDNCCFNRPYDQPLQTRIINEARAKMEIQSAIADGRLDLVTSYMLVAENMKCPIQMARAYNITFMFRYAKHYVSSNRIEVLKPLISKIMSMGIKRADATHVACAIDAGCDYLITVDDRLLTFKDKQIKVITPNDMLYIMEGLR